MLSSIVGQYISGAFGVHTSLTAPEQLSNMNLTSLKTRQALAAKAREAKLLRDRHNTLQEPTERTQIDLMQGSDKEKTTYVEEPTRMKVDLTQESDSDCGECHWESGMVLSIITFLKVGASNSTVDGCILCRFVCK